MSGFLLLPGGDPRGRSIPLDLLDFDRRAAEIRAPTSQMQEPEAAVCGTCSRKKIRVDQELCNQTLRLFRTRVEVKLSSAIRRARSAVSASAWASEILRAIASISGASKGSERTGNIQAMSKCVLRRESLSRRSLGPGARFRVGAIRSLSAVAHQDGGAPPTSPVSTSRNSASWISSSTACRTAAPRAAR